MSEIVIKAENLGKKYVIGHQAERGGYMALRDVLVQNARNFWNKTRDMAKGKPIIQGDTLEEVWALKDVSFEIHRGEAVGIIGRNGAGKSTLLKILSRITEPSTGRVSIKGRVASLLEVGTGFHPELTGRENIYLNGTILGMTRQEIKRKFDEIVAFAEVEKYIDTPVKRYSSGMYMRLAFAVAAHLEPEILVVDEVLAVGDTAFQKKCLGKMKDVAQVGRTVLFVSHNMQAILRLCNKGILLDNGKKIFDGNTQQATDYYLNSKLGTLAEKTWDINNAPGDDIVRLKSIRVRDQHGRNVNIIDIRETVGIEVEYLQLKAGLKPSVGVHLWNGDGVCLFATYDFNNIEWYNKPRYPGIVKSTCLIPGNFLAEGRVFIELYINSHSPTETHHVTERNLGISFDVIDQSFGDGVRGPVSVGWMGVVRPMLGWTVDVLPLNSAGFER